LLGRLITVTLAALTVGLRTRPAGALPRAATPAPEIVLHKGWVFRRTDLADDVRITPRASDAV
jgi:hypothetical protein